MLLALPAWLLPGSCAPAEPPPDNLRQGRFGVLRDLVLFPRAGAPFFLDRFESTRADWQQFLEGGLRPADPESGSLPVTEIDLWQARAFARWRFCRLPRFDEWYLATTGGGLYSFPWGTTPRASWANTAELGLGELTPVGTFESGRRSGGPYDLIGNAAEWTESVPLSWFAGSRDALYDFRIARALVRGHAALRVWGHGGRPLPALWLVQAVSPRVPRLVVGGDFLRPMLVSDIPVTNLPEERLPGDRRATVGVRLAAGPRELLVALMSYQGELRPWEEALVARFASRPGHRAVLRREFPGALAELRARGLEPGPAAELLSWELDL